MATPKQVLAQAPGRVNLIGEHTDYNDGFVLPMALPFNTQITATARTDREVHVESEGFASTVFEIGTDANSVDSWARYVAGMISLLAEHGVECNGFDASITTTIPIGASLSSSAALEVATGFAVCGLAGVTPNPVDIAKLGQRVENEIIGIQSGIMDQLISAVAAEGFATRIDCRSLHTESVSIGSGVRILILDTMTRRELVDSEYDLRRASCERAAQALGVDKLRDAKLADVNAMDDGVDKRRAHHVVTENDRVERAVDALEAGRLAEFGQLMNESHESLSVDYEVSSEALDHMAQLARSEQGCLGARMTGGGFAGSAVALVEANAAGQVSEAISAAWNETYGVTPDIWDVLPSPGASVSVL